MGGCSDGRRPTTRAASPSPTCPRGPIEFDSARIDETQLEQNHVAVLFYRKATPEYGVQVAAYARHSSLAFRPDPLPDLLFNGIAQRVDRSSIATGIQVDGRYTLTPSHTLRGGLLFAADRTSVDARTARRPRAPG